MLLLLAPVLAAPVGYYRMPTIAGDTVVFTSEGDLWKVPVTGGVATRLTSHPGDESTPALSPDGRTVAFLGTYEGTTAVYTMPIDGGTPTRWTWDSGRMIVTGWTPDGDVLYTSDTGSTLPSFQLFRLDLDTGLRTQLPLAEAADGAIDPASGTLAFTRLAFQGSHTRHYQGGTAQQLWSLAKGATEATPLTTDYDGTSKAPMWFQGRIVFVTDRDGTMNLWSMAPDGKSQFQHTHHVGWDVQTPSLSNGKVVYKLGADLRVVDLLSNADMPIPITLGSDLDQTRQHWLGDPVDWVTSAHLAPDGERVVLTARGQVWVAPRKDGRLVQVTSDNARWRDARFSSDGKSIVGLSDASGEVELWQAPANGDGAATQLTKDGVVLRFSDLPSPDGRFIASPNKNQELWLYDTKSKQHARIDSSTVDMIRNLSWSPDGRWLAYVKSADNLYSRVELYDTQTQTHTTLTSDRFDSYAPAWSPDGNWLYFLSDRNLQTLTPSVWGPLQPEPFFANRGKIYALALHKDGRSPFLPYDEAHPAPPPPPEEKDKDKDKKKKPAPATIDMDGLAGRLWEIPTPPADRSALFVNDGTLFWVETPIGIDTKGTLKALAINREHPEPVTLVDGIDSAELSADGKRILVKKAGAFLIFDAGTTPPDAGKSTVDLSAWKPSVDPRREWRQMFDEAWRLERDYFWDPGMSGTDWKALKAKYAPLVERVHSRGELSDVLAQLIAELGVLHQFVYGGEMRVGADSIATATLGAKLSRAADGWKVEHIYQSDPDDPERRSPLASPDTNVPEGSVILRIDGVSTISVPDPAALLRTKAGRQVLLHVRGPDGKESDTIVLPLSASEDADLRYLDWEYSRRQRVEAESKGRIGYVHLRAMSGADYNDFAKGFYPVFNREGLIIDVRHNRGGNIDSWLLSRLSRKAWAFWSQRVGAANSWNMHYAFRGHIVVLTDQRTASDGEAFSEGIKRLGLGRVIGMRTWGGEIWLSSENVLVDNGIATAAEYGVYGPDGGWLIEGRGVEPDDVVDNLPGATYAGQDAQLDAAIRYLQQKMASEPVVKPPEPPKPVRK